MNYHCYDYYYYYYHYYYYYCCCCYLLYFWCYTLLYHFRYHYYHYHYYCLCYLCQKNNEFLSFYVFALHLLCQEKYIDLYSVDLCFITINKKKLVTCIIQHVAYIFYNDHAWKMSVCVQQVICFYFCNDVCMVLVTDIWKKVKFL